MPQGSTHGFLHSTTVLGLVDLKASKFHTQQVPSEDLFLSLIFIHFCYLLIQWHLSPAGSSLSWCQYCFVCSGLAYEIYSGGGPSMYVYFVVCYSVIAAPMCNKCWLCLCKPLHSCWRFWTPLDYELSLLLKWFPWDIYILVVFVVGLLTAKCQSILSCTLWGSIQQKCQTKWL